MIYARSNRIVPDPEQDRGEHIEHALRNIASTNEESTTSAILFICHLQGISDVVPVPLSICTSFHHLLLFGQQLTLQCAEHRQMESVEFRMGPIYRNAEFLLLVAFLHSNLDFSRDTS